MSEESDSIEELIQEDITEEIENERTLKGRLKSVDNQTIE